jgi:hypothetical protein
MKFTRTLISVLTMFLFVGCATHSHVPPAPPSGSADLQIRGLVIRSARWGNAERSADVTARVAQLLRTQRGFVANAEWLLKDPRPYHAKALAIQYEQAGRPHLFVVPGGERVTYEMLVENSRRP